MANWRLVRCPHRRLMAGMSATIISPLGTGRPSAAAAPTPAAAESFVPRRRLLWLGLGTFALGTESLVISGILPAISSDFGVSRSAAGLLVSAFAITYAVAAPITGVIAARFAPKQVLTVAMALFTFANLAAAVAPSFGLLLAARIATGIFASAYTPNASSMAAALSRPDQRGRALAVVYGGLAIATVVGVPLGALIGNHFGWQATFLLVAALGVIAMIGVTIGLPAAPKNPPRTMRQWLAVVRNPRVLAIASTTMVAMMSQFVVFVYVADLITEVTGRATLVPLALFVFGAAGFVGNSLGGRWADTMGAAATSRRAVATMGLSFIAVAGLLALPSGLVATIVAIPVLVVWGIAGWAIIPPQQVRLLAAAPEAGPLVLSVNSSALYAGIALGGAIGGLVLAATGLAVLPLVAAALALAAAAAVRN
jgi:predicted MFS family arabinose efflux permease